MAKGIFFIIGHMDNAKRASCERSLFHRMPLLYLRLLLIQLCAGRDVVVYHQQVQLFFALYLMDSAEQHTAGLDAHHGSRRQVGDGDQCLAYEFFRLIEGMNTGKDGAVCAGSVIQSKLQQLLGLLDGLACLDLNCTEIRLAEGVEVYCFLKQRLYLYL